MPFRHALSMRPSWPRSTALSLILLSALSLLASGNPLQPVARAPLSSPATAAAPPQHSVDLRSVAQEHPNLVDYIVSLAGVIFIALFVALVILVVRSRKRAHDRSMEAHVVAIMQDNNPRIASSTRRPSNLDDLSPRRPIPQHASSSQTLVPQPESSCLRDPSSTSAKHCACPDCISLAVPALPDAAFISSHPTTRYLAISTARAASTTNDSTAPVRTIDYFSSIAAARVPPDENTHREASIRVPPTPPLSPHEHEWALSHGSPHSALQPSTPQAGFDIPVRPPQFPTVFPDNSSGSPVILSDDGGSTSLTKHPSDPPHSASSQIRTRPSTWLSPQPYSLQRQRPTSRTYVTWLNDADWFHTDSPEFEYSPDSEYALKSGNPLAVGLALSGAGTREV
ncbi:hypothetical protein A0H81_13699 [Grifola frondosa]|uniref:Transmembrane protein n=1 Tax=Grifola frondosa TaxID=5627 RepID=A0A1C7LQV5_GRIFR|nr:hypothetical protein A0H81_13699 [Grifola frondosa]